jgi:hypothetical protein
MKVNNNVVHFSEAEVKKYLDGCIRYWRKKKADGSSIAIYYIDAFQSMRVSVFGELLKKEETV